MSHIILMLLYFILAFVCLLYGLDDLNTTVAFWSFLVLAGIEKICLKLEKNNEHSK